MQMECTYNTVKRKDDGVHVSCHRKGERKKKEFIIIYSREEYSGQKIASFLVEH